MEKAENSSNHLAAQALSEPITPRREKSALTAREIEVLRLLADGMTTKAVAAKLGVTFKTAACHRARILQKVGVESTVSAVLWAVRRGIVEL